MQKPFIMIRDDKNLTLMRLFMLGCQGDGKTEETRGRNVFKRLVGQRVGMVFLVGSHRYYAGDCTIGKPVFYKDRREFLHGWQRHRILPDSEWMKDKAVGYPLENIKWLPCMKEAPVRLKGNRSFYIAEISEGE